MTIAKIIATAVAELTAMTIVSHDPVV